MYSLIFSSISTGLSVSQIDSMWNVLKGASLFFQDQSYVNLVYKFVNLVSIIYAYNIQINKLKYLLINRLKVHIQLQ